MAKLSLRGLKIVWAVVILAVSCAWLLPMKIEKISKSHAIMSYLNCFAGGMFLSISFVHMLPESVEQYSAHIKEHEIEKPFPLPYVCLYLGYMLVLLIDKVIVPALDRKPKTVAKA